MPASVPLQNQARKSQSSAVAAAAQFKPSQILLKRTMDLAGSAFLLLLASPLILLGGLLVRLQDGGPAIHRRGVVGKNGEFDAFKLRTMCPDADEVLARDL